MSDPVIGLLLALFAALILIWDAEHSSLKEDYHTLKYHAKTLLWIFLIMVVIGGVGNFLHWVFS